MGVVKKSSSGRALQFITDEGVVYQLSFKLFMMLVNDQINGPFVPLTRMRFGVPSSRFPQSEVYGGGVAVDKVVEGVGDNAFSDGFVGERREQKVGRKVNEVKVDW